MQKDSKDSECKIAADLNEEIHVLNFGIEGKNKKSKNVFQNIFSFFKINFLEFSSQMQRKDLILSTFFSKLVAMICLLQV